MTATDKQIIKSTLHTLIELTYSNMYTLNKEKDQEHLDLLKTYENALLEMVDDKLFKS